MMTEPSRPAESLVPSVARWCGREFRCTCGETHTVPTQQIVLGVGVVQDLGTTLAQCAPGGEVVCVFDDNTFAAAGVPVIEALTAAGWTPRELRLPADCHTDEGTLGTVQRGLNNASAAVAVGAGTINDLTKLATTEAGIPYVVVPTAPSMNGFTSRVGAVLIDGVKRTLPATPPSAVVADLDVLVHAPQDMIAAGLADLQARRCAATDWRMASFLRDEYFCSVPSEMMRDAETRCQRQAAAMRRRDPDALQTLVAALLLSGFSMVIAGSSAPVSGGEHLLSHFWEMTRHAAGKATLLHGLQVGVGTLLSATLHTRLREWDPTTFSLAERAAAYPSWDDEVAAIRSVYGPLTDAVVAEYAAKYEPWERKEEQLKRILSAWPDLTRRLAPLLPDFARTRSTLRAVGAPVTAAELGLSDEEVLLALRWARCLRARYTVLDLAWDLGLLDDWAEAVAAESGLDAR